MGTLQIWTCRVHQIRRPLPEVQAHREVFTRTRTHIRPVPTVLAT